MAREHLAKRYKIPTKIPDNKTRESVMAQKKLTNGSHQNGSRSPGQQNYPLQLPNGNGESGFVAQATQAESEFL